MVENLSEVCASTVPNVEIVLDRRFRGPLTSANGGYTCGVLARYVDGPHVEVTLRLPPPLDTPLHVETSPGSAILRHGADVVAEAHDVHLHLDPPAPVAWPEALDATLRHVRFGGPQFAECFVCGERDGGDCLSLRPGPVAGRPVHAAPWEVAEASPEIVWAAIDCPGAFAVGGEGRGELVLGRMTGTVFRVPAAGDRCVVVSWPLGENGRKLHAGTALFDEQGALLAQAHQVWIVPRPPAEL
jgi:hypothetical protein